MTEFTQVISDADYKKAIAKHYFSYKYTYASPVLGLLLILGLLVVTFVSPEEAPKAPVFLYLLGAFMLLRPLFYVQNVFKSIKTSTFSSNETRIKILEDNRIITGSNGNLTSLNLADLYAYYDTDIFLFLYVFRNQFIILDKRQMSAASAEGLLRSLESLQIKKK